MTRLVQAYRNASDAAVHLLPPLLERRRAELSETGAARAVVVGQIGRVGGGLAALVTGIGAVLAALVGAALDEPTIGTVGAALLLLVPVMAGVGYGIGRALGRRRTDAELQRWLSPSDDPRRDVERLEERGPRAILRDLAHDRGVASLALPMASVAVAGPLFVHLLVYFGMSGREATLTDFSEWMTMSALVVGIAHIALLLLAVDYARRLRRYAEQPYDGMKALGITTLASSFPGALLLLIPPILTFFTGLLVVPTVFAWAKWVRDTEDQRLAAP